MSKAFEATFQVGWGDMDLNARVTSTGGWLDLEARRWTAPPDTLRVLIEALPRTDDYRELESGQRPAE